MHYPKNEKGEFVVPKGGKTPVEKSDEDKQKDAVKLNEERIEAARKQVEDRNKAKLSGSTYYPADEGKSKPAPEKKDSSKKSKK